MIFVQHVCRNDQFFTVNQFVPPPPPPPPGLHWDIFLTVLQSALRRCSNSAPAYHIRVLGLQTSVLDVRNPKISYWRSFSAYYGHVTGSIFMVDQKLSNRICLEEQLAQNEILSDDDRDTVRELLTEAVNELLVLDAESLRLQQALKNIYERRPNIVSRIACLRTGADPRSHRKLPPELLARIFTYCDRSPIDFPASALKISGRLFECVQGGGTLQSRILICGVAFRSQAHM